MKAIYDLFREALTGWMRNHAAVHASSIAYYTILSMAPLLILSISIASTVYVEEDIEWRLVAGVEKRAGAPAATYIKDVIVNIQTETATRLAQGISILFLIWGSSAMFIQLQLSINEMWEIVPRTEAVHHGLIAVLIGRLLSALLVLSMGYMLLILLTVSTLWSLAPVSRLREWAEIMDALAPFVRFLTSPVINTVVFALIFKLLPQATIRWRDIWVGAILTSLLFWLGNNVLGYYLTYGLVSSLYGAAGSVMVFLIWVYYSAWILLFGAKFTQVFASKFGKPIVPHDYMMFRPGSSWTVGPTPPPEQEPKRSAQEGERQP
jgi:membrane protein